MKTTARALVLIWKRRPERRTICFRCPRYSWWGPRVSSSSVTSIRTTTGGSNNTLALRTGMARRIEQLMSLPRMATNMNWLDRERDWRIWRFSVIGAARLSAKAHHTRHHSDNRPTHARPFQ